MITGEYLPILFGKKVVGKVHKKIVKCDICGNFEGMEDGDPDDLSRYKFIGWYSIGYDRNTQYGWERKLSHLCSARCLQSFAKKEK